MPTQQEQLIKKILSVTDTAVSQFSGSIPALQKQILDEVILLVKDLETDKTGTIKNNVANLKTIGKIKSSLEKIVLNDDYLKDVKKFTDAFLEVAKLQNQYFKSIESKFKPSKLLAEIQKQAIGSTITSLTESGIGVNVVESIEKMLRTNITTGGSYSALQTQLRNSILSNKTGGGLLERYTRQVTVDSIQQFNAQYSHAIADDLQLEWFIYAGSNLTTTREFCEHLTKKKFIHVSELPAIVTGEIDDFQVRINPKTKTWAGGIPDTNENNFKINRGGYNCGHQLAPVSEAVVPKAEKTSIKANEIMKSTQSQAEVIDKLANEVAGKFGATVTEINFKSKESVIRKANNEYGGDITRVQDAVRNTIVANEGDIQKILTEFAKNESVLRIKKQEVGGDPLGYSGSIVNIKLPNGMTAEIQINTAKMIYAKNIPADAKRILGEDVYNQIYKQIGIEGGLGHKYYEQYRLLNEKNSEEYALMLELQQLSTEYYSNFR